MSEIKQSVDDASSVLADHAVSLAYEDIPKKGIASAKRSILDTLGVSIGASTITPGIPELIALIKDAGGKEESSILGFGGRVPAMMAAFANGAMAHCMDYDDIYDPALLHPSSATIPASMAIAERIGGVSGKDLLTAVSLGNELVCRLGLSINWKFDWHITPVFGIFGATLSCDKLLGLDRTKIINSLGIALSQASVTMEIAYSPGSELRGMYAAFPAKNAVLSALMAQTGIGGPCNSLEGRAGLYKVYFGGDYNRGVLLDDFGKEFKFVDTGIKLWPNCRNPQPHVDAALRLLEEHHIKSEDIDQVVVHVAGLAAGGSFPLERWRKPTSTLDAKFSVPFSVAVALAKRKLGIREFMPEGLTDPAVLQMTEKITAVHEPAFETKGTAPGKVDIKTRDGQEYSKTIEHPRGAPQNPARDEEIIDKFRECASFSEKPLSRGTVDEAIDMVMNLENVPDVGKIMRLLS